MEYGNRKDADGVVVMFSSRLNPLVFINDFFTLKSAKFEEFVGFNYSKELAKKGYNRYSNFV